jgi:hypothetical protein
MVKCPDCGYLAVRNYETRQPLDAEELFRERGFIPAPGRASIDLIYDEFPSCFARAFDLRIERGGTQPSHDKRGEVVNKPRECPKFTPWVQGFTPKEAAATIATVFVGYWLANHQADSARAVRRLRRDSRKRPGGIL